MRSGIEAGEPSPGRCVPSRERPSILLYEPDRHISYDDAVRLQLQLHQSCASGGIHGALILLEHKPVVTMGVKTAQSNLLVSEQALAMQGIELAKTDRGGDITYHGPGQLVGYPILRLRDYCSDVHGYLRTLEQTIVDTLAHYGLSGVRRGNAGVWVGERKVCSIGIAVRKWVTYHGFALNVDPDMSHFNLINPCGLRSEQLASLAELLGAAPDMAEVRAVYARAFARNFEVDLTPWDGQLP
jgi:lipoate-protein ligase B